MKTPVQSFAIGQAVTWPGTLTGKGARARVSLRHGEIVGATLTGVRHPGCVYTVRATDGGHDAYLPSGLLTATEQATA